MLSGMLLVDVTIFLAAPCTCGADLFLLVSEQETVSIDLKSYYTHSESIASFPSLHPACSTAKCEHQDEIMVEKQAMKS